jgi:hypothetical protein
MQGRNGYLAQTLTRNCAMGSYCWKRYVL